MQIIKKMLILFLSMLLLTSVAGVYAEDTTEAPVQKPFKRLVIPGDIRGCDFDEGGNGIGYFTYNSKNHGSVLDYRQGELMTMYQPASMGITVSFSSREWMEYTVDVLSDGTYDLVARYSANGDTSNIKVTIDDAQSITHNFKSSGGHTTPKTAYMGSLDLTAGRHVVRFEMTSGGVTFEKITFYKAASTKKASFTRTNGAFKKHVLPTTIKAEDYDMGADGSVSLTPWRSDGTYRENNGIEIKKTGVSDYHIVLRNRQSVNYTVEVLEDDLYSLRLLSKCSGRVEVSFNGGEVLNTIPLKPNVEASAGAYYLTKGTHVLTIKSVELNLHLERLVMVRGDSEPDKIEDNTPEKVPAYKEFFVATNGSDENDGSFNAPFLTLEKAKDAAKAISADMKGDIIINIMPGIHKRTQTFTLGVEDSGKNGYDIVYKGFNALSTPILSGGEKITGWEEGENGIWSVHLPEISDMRQLYVDERLAQRAQSRYTYTGNGYWDDPETDYTVEDGIVFTKANFPVFSNPEDAEMVSNLLWTNQRTPIKDVVYEEDKVTVKFDQPYFYWHRTKSMNGTNPAAGTACYFENSFDFLDEKGEFYFDKKTRTLYYMPYNEEDMNKVQTYIGQLEFMVKIEGNSFDEKVENIRFENIDFRHGTWYEPNERGLSDFQADAIVDGPNAKSSEMKSMPGQVHANYADGIKIINCRFINLGSNAVVLERGITNCNVEGNLIRDIAGGGVSVGSFKHVEGEPVENTSRYVDVKNNVIHRIGQEYMSTCAISIYYVQFVNVIHNDIKDLPYTGISYGWGWEVASADCTNNVISHNKIINVSRSVRDGGHIYGVGRKSNIKILNNYMVSSEDYGGIYFDTYSSGTEVRNNVAEECQFWLFGGTEYVSYNLIVKNNYSDSEKIDFFDNDPNGYHWTVPNDVDPAIIKGEDGWGEEPLKIIEESGVEPQYRYMLNDVSFPEWRINRIHDTRTKPYQSPKITTIWAKDWMEGGEGVAYHDKRAEGPRLYKQQTKYVVGDTAHGEWLKYKFSSKMTQNYDIELCCANSAGGADESGTLPKANVYLDDKLLWENIEIPDTGSWQAHVPFVAGNTLIEEGEHTIKVEVIDNGFSFESIIIKAEGSDKTDLEYDDGASQY